jgi:hypothetical protein
MTILKYKRRTISQKIFFNRLFKISHSFPTLASTHLKITFSGDLFKYSQNHCFRGLTSLR